MRNNSKASCLLAGALVDISDAKYFLGLAARDAGQFDEAERLLSESLAGRLSNSGEHHEATLDAKRALEALREERFETPKAMKFVAQSGE